MERPRVCVIDNSPAIRETIAVVLGAEYRVDCLTVDDYSRHPSAVAQADLLVVADDALPAESVAALPVNRPVLWLQRRSQLAAPWSGPHTTLRRSFSPEDLRTAVRDLLTEPPQPGAAFAISSLIGYPMLPHEATLLARRAADTALPVLICGEQGTGKTRLARAIHALSRDRRFVALSAAHCTRDVLQRAGGVTAGNLTVFVNDLHALTDDGQQLLLELLDCGGFRSNIGWHATRLICATSEGMDDLARTAGLDKELFYRLSVLPITLPPLRERPQDIPSLANRVVGELSRVLSVQPVSFTDHAMQRLINYLWFGNLAEFETVLTRSIALAPGRVVDVDDLLFGYGRIAAHAAGEAHAGLTQEIIPEAVPSETVDLIINELAHEFKNPMVTIKTVAQHWERLMRDDAGREQMGRLTGDAVDRMDRALENLLQFTRFQNPAPQATSVNLLLAPCLTALAPTLSERRLTLDYRPPASAPVWVDSAQIGYAFENLLRVLTRDLAEGQTLSIHAMSPESAIIFEVPIGQHPLGKLSALLDHRHEGGEGGLPLGIVFAKTLIERNGGRLEMRSTTEKLAITVWLPNIREESALGNGETASLNS